jgi:tRNA G18 (ribose-2'-O)-methylase SpoU
MTFASIHDHSDPRLEPYRLVQDRDRSSPAGRAGLFIGETAVVIQAMLRVPQCTVSVLAAERHEERVRQLIAQSPESSSPPDVFLVPDRIVEPLTGFNLHRGLLAVGRRPDARSLASFIPPPERSALLLCVESVNNMDNIGQLFRVAAAFGCCGALLSQDCHDPFYRKSLRVSCGCALSLPHARSQEFVTDLTGLREEHRFTVIGATGSGQTTLTELSEMSTETGARTALVVGAEFSGLSAEALRECSLRARIPMAPQVDSLNVATAAAVFLSRLNPALQR